MLLAINYFCKKLHLRFLTGFECISLRFSEHLFPNICVSQLFLIGSSGMQFQTMPNQSALSNVFRLALKNLCSTFNHLYLFECVFLQVQVVCKDNFYVPFLCVYVTLQRIFFDTKKWNNYCLLRVRKRFFHILLRRED